MSSFGERIKSARDKKKLSQSKVADECSVSSAAIISNWEKNVNKPDIDKLMRLCITLEVTPNYLLDIYSSEDREISSEEWEIVQDLRDLDEERLQPVLEEIKRQKEILTQWEKGYRVSSPHEITLPVFLTEKDTDYKRMKALCAYLCVLREEKDIRYEDITRFLWSIGYGENICLANVIGIFKPGRKVPNQQLFTRIEAFLKGQYKIIIEGED